MAKRTTTIILRDDALPVKKLKKGDVFSLGHRAMKVVSTKQNRFKETIITFESKDLKLDAPRPPYGTLIIPKDTLLAVTRTTIQKSKK